MCLLDRRSSYKINEWSSRDRHWWGSLARRNSVVLRPPVAAGTSSVGLQCELVHFGVECSIALTIDGQASWTQGEVMSRFQNTLDKVACGSKGLRVRSRGSWSMFILSLIPSEVRNKSSAQNSKYRAVFDRGNAPMQGRGLHGIRAQGLVTGMGLRQTFCSSRVNAPCDGGDERCWGRVTTCQLSSP